MATDCDIIIERLLKRLVFQTLKKQLGVFLLLGLVLEEVETQMEIHKCAKPEFCVIVSFNVHTSVTFLLTISSLSVA